MPRILRALLFALLGFVVTAVAGYFLVDALSSNRHDRAVEAAMTSLFVLGPLGAIVAGVAAWIRARA